MSKSLATAYSIKRRAKKMAEGGPVKKQLHQDIYGADRPYVPENQEHSQNMYGGYKDSPEPSEHDKLKNSLSSAFHSKGGMIHKPENIVKMIREVMANHKKNKMAQGGEVMDEAPLHEDDEDLDFDPRYFADGGDVSGVQSAQDSMRKAFHFDEGGDVESRKKDRMKRLMGSMLKGNR